MSLKCNFLTFGEWGPTDVAVERVNTSRSFAGRRAKLTQGPDTLVAVADLTFHRPESGADSQHVPPPAIASPGDLEAVPVVFGTDQSVDPFEVRPGSLRPVLGERFHPFWARTREPLPENPVAHAAALAFMSDYVVIHSPFDPGSGQGEGLRSFTLEHSLWFHRAFDASRWMLFDCSPLTQSSGRYVSRGTVHDEHGVLLASFVQEGFIRPVRSEQPLIRG
jgi:acyl-CoA thioesterase-2